MTSVYPTGTPCNTSHCSMVRGNTLPSFNSANLPQTDLVKQFDLPSLRVVEYITYLFSVLHQRPLVPYPPIAPGTTSDKCVYVFSGMVTPVMFVQYKRSLFCALTRLELIRIASTPNSFEIIFSHFLFCPAIITFSNRKYFGLTILTIRMYSQNRYDCPSNSKPSSFSLRYWLRDVTSIFSLVIIPFL